MAFSNLGFESPGALAGEAQHWTITATTAAERVAVWGAGDPPLDEDSFEREWGNDAYQFELELSDTTPTLFDRSVSEGEAAEDFEEGWSGNQGYLFELSSVDVLPPEDFSSWGTGYDFMLGATSVALFDAALLDPYEDFEDSWAGTGAGNDYLFNLGASAVGLFDGSAEPWEDFEQVRAERQVSADPVADLFTSLTPHGLGIGDRCSFRLVGSGALPAGLNSSFMYHVISLGLSPATFRVSVASGGATLDLTDAGAGVFVVTHDRTRFWILEYSP